MSNPKRKSIQTYFNVNNPEQMAVYNALKNLKSNPKYCMFDVNTFIRFVLYQILVAGEIDVNFGSPQIGNKTQPAEEKETPAMKMANDFIKRMTD